MSANDIAATLHGREEVETIDLWPELVRHRRLVAGGTLLAAVSALVVSLLLPNVYTGTTRILPPQQSQSSAAALLNQMGGLLGIAGSSLGGKNPGDLYVTMLKSRNIMEKVAGRFDLRHVYEEDTLTETLKRLNKNVSVTAGREGVITVEVEDGEAERSAALANAFIEELDRLMQSFALTDASQKRAFFEQQMKLVKDKVTSAELLLDQTPRTSLHYLDAVRDLRYQEAVFEILARQFEMAKLDESKNYPLIQVLDRAAPAELRTRPRRLVIVALVTAAACCLTLAFVWWSAMRVRREGRQ